MKASQTETVIMLTCCALQSACYSPTGIVILFILAQFQGEVQTNLTEGTRQKCAFHRARRFRMPAACALGKNSGKIILIEQCRAVCGPPGIAFSQMELGRQGADAAPASYGSGGAAGEELALSASLRSAALPKGDPLAWRQGFQLNCEVSSFARASPFGRGVTAGDGEGSLS